MNYERLTVLRKSVSISCMLMIRLQRVGRRNDPSYRVVLIDRRRAPQSGAFKEILGSYDPRREEQQLEKERIAHWLSDGAQASPTVYNLLVEHGLIEGKKKNVLPQKSPVKSEKEEQVTPETQPDAGGGETEEDTEEQSGEENKEAPVESNEEGAGAGTEEETEEEEEEKE